MSDPVEPDAPPEESAARTEIPADLAERIRRYAQLRCAQRALFPLRPLTQELPGEQSLQEIRERLLKVRLCPLTADGAPSEGTDPRETALGELDGALDYTSAELRSALEQISFSELRATLPEVRATRTHEVEALLNLCLEDEPPGLPYLRIIEYLTTLLSTEAGSGGRKLCADPLSVTERLRQVCRGFSDSDPAEVQRHIETFEEGIAELDRSTILDPLMQRMRDKKDLMGTQILVPAVFQKAIEYNVAVSMRLHQVLESERALSDLDIEALIELDEEWDDTPGGEIGRHGGQPAGSEPPPWPKPSTSVFVKFPVAFRAEPEQV